MRTTEFFDIDGTLLFHTNDMSKQHLVEPELLPGAREKILELEKTGAYIILTTGRKESTRKATEEQLSKVGIIYDLLIMGLPNGLRRVWNDMKPNSEIPMAVGITFKRNEGLVEFLEKK